MAHARWSETTQWRDQFLAFARQDGIVTREFVTAFFEATATLPALMTLLHHLMQEKVLLARDGKRLEEALLRQRYAPARGDGT